MLQYILLMIPLTVTAQVLSFPPRPSEPKLIRLRDFKRVRSIASDYVVNDFVGLVEEHGYSAEEHNITTKDGYQISFHRIPGSPKSPKKEGKPVIFLQHGLTGSSDFWVIVGPNKDLAADAGFDVWVGNVRGNSYARRHIRYSPDKDPEFWFYSYHLVAMNDIPAMIDYILKLTNKKSLTYIGHSQGTTVSYALLSMKPEYNAKINLVISLSPVTIWVKNLPPLLNFLLRNAKKFAEILRQNKVEELVPQSPIILAIGKTLCNNNSKLQFLCVTILFLLSGINVQQMNSSIFPKLLSHCPAGTSIQSVLHYRQNLLNQGIFQAYDYGNMAQNLQVYNNTKPPIYNLQNVVAPVVLFYGLGDIISGKEEALELSKHLSNLVSVESVPDENFNHLDFLLAKDAKKLLYDRIINFATIYSKN